ncbi:glycosyltransferase family 2 protein [Agrobacterium rubi]|uniref:glycosyltransferase family 2 protein n=1 Tax=Agrobacterium rubi TaxID=28099 RepID=UPI0015727764|nr:glycosyltransferase family 2 protein [Agrobacterium rubi]NTF06701.1 glycosyltransferase family 2 protein [Agrobacterium rubi]NTF18943.1 glycosyltransferase family 2 protein [Agrobacterium rubi]NTF25906.1 glycosyltransferase family 2 protein [Agrobacterium rubi]
MSSSEILLSICVPTYNRQFLLERNVNFHLEWFRRLGMSFEIVLVDDCSTDGTADYIKTLADVPEVSAYRRVKNSGFVSNYAFAMRRARGRYAVFLGDDDLLIPEKVKEYVEIMQAEPSIGMVQAPWLLVDARGGQRDIGPFYRIPGPTRHSKADFSSFLNFIFNHHVFPEFLIVRRDVLAKSISSATPFIFWAYLYTVRALDKADVLFMPEPFARVTAISDDPRMQQGNNECMFQWDTYRGGIEFLAAQMWKNKIPSTYERDDFFRRLTEFMMQRQGVALRLHIEARNWPEAYILYNRMAAYQNVPLAGTSIDTIQKLAGLVVAAKEAAAFSDQLIIIDPAVGNDIVDLLPPAVKDRITRELPSHDDGPRAWLRLDPRFGEPLKRSDAAFDLPAYLEQFI